MSQPKFLEVSAFVFLSIGISRGLKYLQIQDIGTKERVQHDKLSPIQEKNELTTNPECEDCSKLKHTVKSYDKHAVVCAAYEWPSAIEKVEPIAAFVNAIAKLKKAIDTDTKIMKVKITACNQPQSNKGLLDIIVYPDNCMYKISIENIDDFAYALLTNSLQTFPQYTLPWKTLVLICIHNKRDKRCGEKGPKVINEFLLQLKQNNIPESSIAVRGSSHLGGHEFAGTLIVYPACDWYGYIKPESVSELLTHIMNGTRLEKCWRGNGNENPKLEW
eukprot:gene1529-2947_t